MPALTDQGAMPRLFFLTTGLAAAAMLSAAFYFQYVEGLAPCALCIYQRIPYGVVVALAVVGWLIPAHRQGNIFALGGLIALTFLTDSAIAGYHAGVEQGWWQGTSECSGTGLDATSIEDLRAAIFEAPNALCTDIAWQFLGLSMAAWNGIIALALAVFSLSTLQHWRKESSA